MLKSYTKILFVCVFLFTQIGQSNTPLVSETKTKIKQLENKISTLQYHLSHAHDKHMVLNQELANIEKQNSLGINQLRSTQQKMAMKQQTIANLEQKVNQLTQQLHTQQQLLADHVRARYSMGEDQPLHWLLNQDDPSATSRLLTFYQYIVQSREQAIANIQQTTKSLAKSQEKLHQEWLAEQHLQQELHRRQQKLIEDKRYHAAIIRALDQDIQSKQHVLNEYKQNKNNLAGLLKTLMQQSIVQTQRPFVYMRKKLPRPVAVNGKNLERVNQGVVFFANEGNPVVSVYSGKVVFSDWLKGYGLLMIIDHGHGFMSLYAHNQSLFKQKGDTVRQGEQIATVGHSGGLKQNGLYFEIRQRGKAIPPLAWLS